MAERTRRRAATSSRRSTGEDSGGRLNRDYSGEEYREPGEGYNGPTPKKGLYPGKLVTINDHESKDGNESVRWGFEITGGTSPDDNGDEASVAGFRDYQYTNDDTTLWREQQIAVALGLVKPNGKLSATYAAILKKAKPCTLRIIRERYIPEDGGDPEWRAKIAAVLTARDLGATKTARRPKDEDAEDVFDDDEPDDEDDEPEEEPPTRTRRSTTRSRRKAAEPEPEEEESDDEDEGEDEDDQEEPYDPDVLAAELEDLSLAALKKRARDEFEVTIKRGMTTDDIIEAILDTLPEDDEEEEEEPPPPPRRSRAAAKTTTRRKRGSSEDPPF